MTAPSRRFQNSSVLFSGRVCYDGKEIKMKPDLLPDHASGMISTDTLGEAFEPEQRFENPDGTPILFNTDFFGRPVSADPLPGPFASKEDWREVLLV